VLFAAGMTLLDTIDGSFMNLAYGWALSEPVRKVYYNLTLTAMSVAIALIVGSIELLGVLVGQLGWTGGAWDWVGDVDLNIVGFVVVGVFVATWIVALVVWKYAHVEEKWKTDRPR
jgi:high-affinity nickel-transport protein